MYRIIILVNKIQKDLFELSDKNYKVFSCSLTPGIKREDVIGVRIPVIRRYSKSLFLSNKYQDFLSKLPHKYQEENILHAALIEQIKDYDESINRLNIFLPYVDNWCVCDTCCPKIYKKYPDKFIKQIKIWLRSKDTYTIRFAIKMLMSNFLDDYYDPKYLKWVYRIRSEEYYINMMKAWYFATALYKQYDDAIKVIEEKKLDDFSHNKTIQKAIESYRIDDKTKEYLRTLKV